MFESAHIYPVAYLEHWVKKCFSSYLTLSPELAGFINSSQNGILLLFFFFFLYTSGISFQVQNMLGALAIASKKNV